MTNGSEKARLEKMVDSCHFWSRIATLAILIGIIVEFVVLWWFTEGITKEEKWTLGFADLLIAGGLYAEYWLIGKAATADAGLQRISDEKIAQLDKEAADAKLKLEKAKRPRILPGDKLPQFIEQLRPFARTVCEFSTTGHEANKLILQIGGMIETAGWVWNNWHGAGLITVFETRQRRVGRIDEWGVHIRVFDPSLEPARDALAEVLRLSDIEGVNCGIADDPSRRSIMEIIVGDKI